MNLITCTSCEQENPGGARFCSRCGVPLPQPNASSTGSSLAAGTCLRDRYIIRYPLGQGGFSCTYLAEDTGRFHQLVTLKELTPTNLETYALQKAEELFQREAEILHQLSSPQIPRFWEFFRDGTRLFLVQDYIAGKTYQSLLKERTAAGEPFTEEEILQLLWQILPVLSYLHSLGVIHRDISPDNIICRSPDGLPVLIDLGGVTKIQLEVATPVGSSPNAASSSSTRLGKIGYAPDEQLRLGIAAPHSDLYALGVTALVLMTDKQPQELLDLETMEWRWQEHLTLSPIFTGIINRMLASQPVERFQSADELLQQLATFMEMVPTQVYSPVVHGDSPALNPVPVLVNNSGCGNLFDDSVKVPDEIPGWNWGAFLLPGLWSITNQVWIGLLAWADFSVITLPLTFGTTWPIMAVILGVKGNEWAWKSRSWSSIQEFKRHQRRWAIAGFLIMGVILIIFSLIFVALLAMGIFLIGNL